jgi:hypothetical protein
MVARTTPAGFAKSAQPGLRWVGERSSQPTAVDPQKKSFVAKHFERMLKTGAKPGGFFGDWHAHVFTYNPERVQPCASPFFSRDLTVCYSVWVWVQHLVSVLIAVGIMLGCGRDWAFPDGRANGACNGPNMGMSTVNQDICHLEHALDVAKTEFRFLVPFILSGVVGVSVATWQKRRHDYSELCGAALNLNVQLGSIVPLRPELAQTRETLHRWVMLAFELSMLKSRDKMDSDEGREYLERSGLLLPEEWDPLVNGDRHTTVCWWIQVQIRQLADEKIIASPNWAGTLFGAVSAFRAKGEDMMSSVDRDQPYPYLALCGLLVQWNIIFMTVWTGVKWAIWHYGTDGEIWTAPKLWFEMAVLFTWNLSYQALFDLCKMLLGNPFGDRRIDVAHNSIGQGVAAFSRSVAAGTPHLPPTMSPGVTAAWNNSESPAFIAPQKLESINWSAANRIESSEKFSEKFGFGP